jgi:hypothetical protein
MAHLVVIATLRIGDAARIWGLRAGDANPNPTPRVGEAYVIEAKGAGATDGDAGCTRAGDAVFTKWARVGEMYVTGAKGAGARDGDA